jgi:hypothetical protein
VASGACLAEVANLRWVPGDPTTNDLDLDRALIRVQGKGGRDRPIRVGAKAMKRSIATCTTTAPSTGWPISAGYGSGQSGALPPRVSPRCPHAR